MKKIDLTSIRRENLKRFFSDKKYPDKDKSLISQQINGSAKSFGERLARRLEKDYGMGEFYLDTPVSVDSNNNIVSNIKEIGAFELWDRHTPLSNDEIEVPFFKEIRLSAGNGFADDIMDYNNFKLRFSKATLRRQGVSHDNAVCVTADGNSMEPVIPDGTTVGIDLGNKTIRDGKIYAINHGGLLRIKILYNMPNNQVKIRSYNSEEHPDEVANLEDITVLGKVFWYSVLL